ncbi:hypothetical protein SISSUDRAFT_981801 [Sistotremastrum suecicum HHB10207 ss-3]|uniref:FAD/NAD(P)-binding domain-containing protein n=1 Tax=Sistotremastrum suecicum HHB10207 ss-3 TaxID=1314776 RepID=A0A166G8Q8_9AGAM|nr:hypothetical protein SISSUDRAFT_981801 [Sistotremastrum suecicum HHB10207 ss-3]
MSSLIQAIPPQILYPLSFIAGLVLFLGPISTWYRNKKVTELTALNDLADLGKPRIEGKRIDGTAVVAGGSVAGLLTARVCSAHFSRVLIVEPEGWTATAEGLSDEARLSKAENGKKPNIRTRVQQYTSLHSYQPFTYLALKEMFPDFEAEARKIDPAAIAPCDFQVHLGGRHLRPPLGFYKGTLPKFLTVSRPAYETLLRKLVKNNCDNVEFVTGTVTGINIDVDGPSQGLEGAGTGDRIQSVVIRSKEGVETAEPALLLADCTGPSLAALKWVSTPAKPLKVPKDVYDPKMYYTTCEYNIEPAKFEKVHFPGGFANASVIYNFLPDSRMERRVLLVFKRENNTLQFVCGGWDLAARPKSIADVRSFMSQIKGVDPVPDYMFQIADALEASNADATASYTDVKLPPCHFVKYHQVLDKIPTNLIAVGDAVLRVNPIRGQGCTKAAIGAATLSGVLQYCNPVFHSNSSREVLPDQFGKMFFERQNSRIQPVWDQTKAEDYGWDTTTPVEGESLTDGAWVRWYTWNLIAVALNSDSVGAAVYNSAMFIAPGTDVTTPGIALQVAWAGIKVGSL